MEVTLHFEVLHAVRRKLLPLLQPFREDFYLAGVTGLALQLGHRVSQDFDFYTAHDFDSTKLYYSCEKIFTAYRLKMIQQETNTLSILLNNTIKISF